MKWISICVALFIAACSKHEAPSGPRAVSVEGDKIIIDANSPLLKRMEIAEIPKSTTQIERLRTVGQIIALANRSGELINPQAAWVELDPEISRSVGMNFRAFTKNQVGDAYGVTSISTEYLEQIHSGERIEVSRYGLGRSNIVKASVVSIQRPTKEVDSARVLFYFPHGQEWYPGTNCDVTFPMIQSRPVLVSTNALLHEGANEYVLKEIMSGQFKPMRISIVGSTPDSVLVIGMNEGDRIIRRGAILLKPLVHQLLSVLGEAKP